MQPGSVHGDNVAERTARHEIARGLHDRIVPAMMAGEHRHLGFFGGLDDRKRVRDRIGDGFLDNRRDAARDCRERGRAMQRIRVGDNRAIGLRLVEQCFGIEKMLETVLARIRGGCRRWVGNAGDFQPRFPVEPRVAAFGIAVLEREISYLRLNKAQGKANVRDVAGCSRRGWAN